MGLFDANLNTVETQIDTLRSSKELAAGDIANTRIFIEKERKNYPNTPLESKFREWEDLVGNVTAKKENDKNSAIAETKEKAAKAKVDADKSREEQSLKSEDITANKQAIREALADLSPDKIESSLASTERLLEMCPEKYKTLLEGFAGSMILEAFEKHKQYIIISPDNIISIASPKGVNKEKVLEDNNATLALKMNTLVKNGKLDINLLKTGLLFRAESFSSYSSTVRSAESGKVLNPQDSKNPDAYFKYLKTQKDSGYKLSASEEALLASADSFGSYKFMNEAIEQCKDFKKLNTVILKQSASNKQIISSKEGVAGVGDSQHINNLTSNVGEGIGTIGGTIGKIAGAGARGGLSVLSDVLATASKEGGAWGALAVLGGLIASIWKFGLWKTLGGIFGIGLVSEATSGRLDLGKEMEKMKTVGGKIGDQVKFGVKPLTEKMNEAKKRLKKNKEIEALDEEKFNSIHDSLATSEDFTKLPIARLEEALDKKNGKTIGLFFADISDINGVKGSEFYNRDPENTEKILRELIKQKESNDVTIADLFVRVGVGEEKLVEKPLALSGENFQEGVTPHQMEKEAMLLEEQGYSSLYVLARGLEMGFIPKTHDFALKDPVPMKGRKWEWVKLKASYVFEGGAMTNGTLNVLNKSHVFANNFVLNTLKADILLEKIQARELLTASTTLPRPDITNINERINVLNSIERALASGGDKSTIAQLLRDYKALSGKNFSQMAHMHNMSLLSSKVTSEGIRLQQSILNAPNLQAYDHIEAKITSLRAELSKSPVDKALVKQIRGEIESVLSGGFKFSGNRANVIAQLDMVSQSVSSQKQTTQALLNMDAKLQELQVAIGRTPVDASEVTRLRKEYEVLSGSGIIKTGEKHIHAAEKERQLLEQAKQRINQIDTEIRQLKNEAKTKLTELNTLAGKDPARVQALSAEGERIIQEINNKIVALETEGVKNLQALNPQSIKNLATQSPWVSNIMKANNGLDGLIQTKTGKFLMGTALLTVVWNSKDGLSDMWKKGFSKENLGVGGDLAIGFIPVIGGAHDLMIANADWYKKLWLGDRKLTTEELVARNAFGAIGLVPGLGTITKAVGKGSVVVVRSTEVAIHGAQLAGKVGMYGYLGYSLGASTIPLAISAYDLASRK